ncbi:MAG: hypothetical protein ACYTGB_00385 [Planctomycetota bacterium]|jgi:hypothetical protein
MRTIGTLAVLWALLTLPGRAAELAPADGADRAFGGYPGSTAGEKPRRKLTKEPKYAGEKPIYISIDIGSGKDRFLTAVLDEGKGTGKGYDKLYLDTNNNGDLTDDPEVKAKVQDRGNVLTVSAGQLTVTVRYEDGGSRQLAITPQIYRIKRGDAAARWIVRYVVMQHLEGKLQIDGLEMLVGLYDRYDRSGPANGCFNDFGRDALRIDTDGDGKLGTHEEMPLSRILSLAGKLRELKVGADGRGFSLADYSGKTGDLRVSCAYARGAKVETGQLTFVGAEGCALTHSIDWKAAVSLPAGTWRIGGGTLTLTDAAGASWTLALSGSKPFEVAADGTAMLTLGSPIKVEPVVSGKVAPGSRVSISHKVIGAAGEVYSTIAKGGRSRTPPPSVKVLDAAGTQLASGKMEYG